MRKLETPRIVEREELEALPAAALIEIEAARANFSTV
jgi:hypothetical protein